VSYKVQVVWKNGKVEDVMLGCRKKAPAVFRTRKQAQEEADFLKMGIEEETQSINVVRCPPYSADRGGNDD
jgi:hypothetical protein